MINATEKDIGRRVVYWPWDNRTEDCDLVEIIEPGYYRLKRYPDGKEITAFERSCHWYEECPYMVNDRRIG